MLAAWGAVLMPWHAGAAPVYGAATGGGSRSDLFDISQGSRVIHSTPQYPALGLSDVRAVFGYGGNGAWVEGPNAIFQDGTPGFTDVVEWQTPGWVTLQRIELRLSQDTGSGFRGVRSYRLLASQDGVNFTQVSGGDLPMVDGRNAFTPLLVSDDALTGTVENVRAFRLELVRLTQGGPRVIELDGHGVAGERPAGAKFLDRLAFNAATNTYTGRGSAAQDDEGPGGVTEIIASSRVLGTDTPEDAFGNNNGAVEPENFILGDGGKPDSGDRIMGNGGETIDFLEWVTAEPVDLAGYRLAVSGDGASSNRDTELVRFLVDGQVADLFDNDGRDGATLRTFADGAVRGSRFRLEVTKTTISGARILEVDALTGSLPQHSGGVVINELCAENHGSLRDEDGNTPDWVELFNNGSEAADLSGWHLSDEPERPAKWTFPAGTVLEGRRFLVVFLSDKNRTGGTLHTNFQIKAGGEELILSRPDGTEADRTPAVRLGDDRSWGRHPSGSGAGAFFLSPTPGYTNSVETPWTSLVHEKPEVSVKGGWHPEPVAVELTSPEPNVTLRYTLDGSDPTPASPAAEGPVLIRSRAGDPNVYSMIEGTSIANQHTDGWKPPVGEVRKATVLRARAFREGAPPGPIRTQTYFIGPQEARNDGLPTLAIASDPRGLFDHVEGIYMLGRVFEDWRAANPGQTLTGHTPANYTQRGARWERPGHLEWFDAGMGLPGGGARRWGEPIALDIQGQSSRSFRQKSFGIKARGDGGRNNSIGFRVFPGLRKLGSGEPLKDFRHLRLRNYGNDWDHAMMRDSFAARLAQPLGLAVMSSRPAQIYLDGEYWGMLEVRENQDPRYLQAHYGIDDDEAVILHGSGHREEGPPGSETPWTDLLAWAATRDFANTADYERLAAQVDVEDALLYFLSEIYFANADWPQNNIRVWRRNLPEPDPALPKGQDGKWRWLLFDVDLGLAHPWSAGVGENTLAVALAPNGRPAVPQTHGTRIFRSLMQNAGWRERFINTAAVLLSAHFSPARAVELVDRMQAEMEPGMEEHTRRWQPAYGSVAGWRQRVSVLRQFAQQRAPLVRSHIAAQFSLGGSTALTLDVAGGGHRGTLRVAGVLLDEAGLGAGAPWPWRGDFFPGQTVSVEAVPAEGWFFDRWSGVPDTSRRIALSTDRAATVSAHFVPEPPRAMDAGWTEDGRVEVILSGTPLATYEIESSADLVSWQPAAAITTGADGVGAMQLSPLQAPRMFVRVVSR